MAWIAIGALYGYCAWATYRLRSSGWWLVVLILVVLTASNAVTYSRHSVTELYELMGFTDQQLRQIQQFNFLDGGMMVWGSVGFMVPILGYLAYAKRFFGTCR